MSCRAVALAALVFALAAPLSSFAASPPVEVTACGQSVPSGSRAVLTTDLDCPTTAGAIGIALGRGVKLDLQGHTVKGGIASITCGTVPCDGTWCAADRKSGNCEVTNGTIRDARYVAVTGSKVVVRNVAFVDNYAYDVLAFHKADVHGSSFQNAYHAVQANLRIRLYDSTLDGSSVQAAKKVELYATSVTNAPFVGVYGRTVRLVGSSVTGNGTDPGCGVDTTCGDIAADKRPVLDATSTCERSLRRDFIGLIPSWGVCTLD